MEDYKISDLNNLFEQIDDFRIMLKNLELKLNEQEEAKEYYKKPFLTVVEAAEYLDIQPSTIYTYISKGKISHYRPGKMIYFSYQDLNDFALNKNSHFRSDKELKKEAINRNISGH